MAMNRTMASTDEDEYDKDGDGLFDDLDEDDFKALESRQTPPSTLRPTTSSAHEEPPSKRRCVREDEDEDEEDEYDRDAEGLFDDVDFEALEAGQPSSPMMSRDDCIQLARRLLKESFGYDAFRHEQEAAIANILQRKNTLVVFPTGAGKSLCYQIPALAFPEMDAVSGMAGRIGGSGITIVVSPLIALMKDQVDALIRKGVKAECIDSTKSYEQQLHIGSMIRSGTLRILYCAPERLNNEAFVESIKTIPGGVRLVAVDEAHCVSEWGHSFRPEYLKVARFTQEIGAERVICLTATATPKVAADVCAAFHIDSKTSLFKTSPYRPNLQLLAQSVSSKQAKHEPLFKFLNKYPGSSLVYVTLQQQAEILAADLVSKGFNAVAFHAGLKADVKSKIQDDFMSSAIRIVVATIAFGMGIDKPDIRSIVHFDMSSTVEEYSQQIGRAGRDGKTSVCMFYICRDDFYLRENFARGDLPARHSLKRLLKDIFKSDVTMVPIGEAFKTNHYQQGRDFDIRDGPLRVIYAILELRWELIRAIQPEYREYTFTLPSPSQYTTLLNKDKSPEARAILSEARQSKTLYHFNIGEACKKYRLNRSDVVRKLNTLHDSQIIDMKGGGVEPRYRVLKKLPRTEKEIDELARNMYGELEFREEDALRKTQQVADLITAEKCFALGLAEHFGMRLPDGKLECGHCTFCMTHKAVYLAPADPPPVNWTKVNQILAACDVRDDPRFLARFAFGIKSPRITQLKLDKSSLFRSLADHDFKSLLAVFTNECKKAGFKNGSASKSTYKKKTYGSSYGRGSGKGYRGGYGSSAGG